MKRQPLPSTDNRLRWLHSLALIVIACTHICIAGLLTQPTIAFGQGEPAETVQTEILWMEGYDLVQTRQIPQARPAGFFRNGWIEIRGDRKEDKRIGRRREWRIDVSRDSELRKFVFDSKPEMRTQVTGPTVPPADRGVPQGSIESTHSQETLQPVRLPNPYSVQDDSALEKQGQAVDNHQPQLDQRANVRLIDDMGRQVVLVVPHSGNIGFTNQINRQSPVESTLEPLTIAAISFALGTVFCGVLCAVLLLVSMRGSIQRQTELGLHGRGTAFTMDPTLETPASTSVSRTPHVHNPAFRAVGEQNKASSVVEEFYQNNVALLKQLQSHRSPSVGDGNGKKNYHIGAAHG